MSAFYSVYQQTFFLCYICFRLNTLLKCEPESPVLVFITVGSLLSMVCVSVATVSNWRKLPPSFANLKKCFDFTTSNIKKKKKILNQSFFPLKMPIEAEMN